MQRLTCYLLTFYGQLRQLHRMPVKVNSFVYILLCLGCGSAQADVQVLQIKDATATTQSANLTDATGATGPGATDRLCVVNSVVGHRVRLSFQNANGGAGDGLSWKMLNAITGDVRFYRQSVSLTDGSSIKSISTTASNTYDVPAASVVASTAQCSQNGNVTKWFVYTSAAPGAGTWSDSVQVTASDLP